MNKNRKILIAVIALFAILCGGLLSWLFFFTEGPSGEENVPPEEPPEFKVFSPNTYAYNSTIDILGYAIQFNESQILLEEALSICNGSLNGYELINSTILNNSIILSNESYISIALYRNQNLTLRNIWNVNLNLVLCANSSVSFFNCSIQELVTTGNNDIMINNSTIKILSVSGNFSNERFLKCTNNSHIEMCMIQGSVELDIDFTTFQALYSIISEPYKNKGTFIITGQIKNCSIGTLYSTGQSKLDLYGTEIHQVNLMANSQASFEKCNIFEQYVTQSAKAILNNSKISSELQYGIIIYSGIINITDGLIEGATYINNTQLINTNVSSLSLESIVVNGTGQLKISNYSNQFYLYDSAKLIVNNSNSNSSSVYGCYFQDSSEVLGINSTFEFLYCNGNAKLIVIENSYIKSAIVNSSGKVNIKNSHLKWLSFVSDYQNGDTAFITNCTIDEMHALPSQKVNISNSTVNNLFEGLNLKSGDINIDLSGISGLGTWDNNINFTETVVINSTYKYIVIKDDINVSIENLHDYFTIYIDKGSLTIFNSTMDSLRMRFDSQVNLNNCSFRDNPHYSLSMLILYGQPMISCFDNSSLLITNNSIIPNNNLIMLYDNAEVIVEASYLGVVYVYNEAELDITDSEIYLVRLSAYSNDDYSLDLFNCSIAFLLTSSWKLF